MTDDEILSRLTAILRDLLDDGTIALRMNTVRDSVPNWDSFGYVSFIAIVEHEFGVQFGVAEVESFPDVGAIVARIQALRA